MTNLIPLFQTLADKRKLDIENNEPFGEDGWRSTKNCWEFVALPAEAAGWASLLPDLCHSVLSEHG